MIRPPVQEGRRRSDWTGLVLFVLGAGLSSAAIGATLGLLGGLVSGLLPDAGRGLALPAVAVAGLAMAAAELRGARLTIRRQTRSHWYRAGRRRAWFMWGLDLGLGFSTFRVGSLYWMLWLLVLVIGSPGRGAIVMVVYSLGLTAAIGLVPFWLERRVGRGYLGLNAARWFGPHRLALDLLLAAWSVGLLAAALFA